MSTFRVEADVDEGTDFTLVGAIAIAVAGQSAPTLITQSDVNGTITMTIYEAGNATAVYGPVNLVTASVIFNTPQLDAFWEDMDDIGYNFRQRVRQADHGGVLKGSRRYTILVNIPTDDDGTLRAVWVPNVIPLHI